MRRSCQWWREEGERGRTAAPAGEGAAFEGRKFGILAFALQCVSVRLLTAKPMLGRSVFTQKGLVFGPRTAKSQPIWIKFYIHLLLYGIHLWADLHRDLRMGGSRPNQNDCFCNTCNAPYIRRIAAISAANRQSGGEDRVLS